MILFLYFLTIVVGLNYKEVVISCHYSNDTIYANLDTKHVTISNLGGCVGIWNLSSDRATQLTSFNRNLGLYYSVTSFSPNHRYIVLDYSIGSAEFNYNV